MISALCRIYSDIFTLKLRFMQTNQAESPTPKDGNVEGIIEYLPDGYTRKDFLRTAGSVALFAALGISFTACSSKSEESNNIVGGNLNEPKGGIVVSGNKITIDTTSTEGASIAKSGGWLLIVSAQTLVVNVDGNLVRAFTSICPHASCDRNWSYQNDQFRCTCHDSRFTNAGVRVSGPATRNLAEFAVVKSGNTVTITK